MSMALNTPVDLFELLARKESRAKNQLKWLQHYGVTLISFTINMPGAVKLNDNSCRIFSAGVDSLIELCKEQHWSIVARQILHENTGPEGIFAIDGPSASILKKAVMDIENHHPLGRLMDLDVINLEGKVVSRKAHGIGPRHCILCDDIAANCARSQRHELDMVLHKIEEMVHHCEYCN
jgi:holo-ACP synthase